MQNPLDLGVVQSNRKVALEVGALLGLLLLMFSGPLWGHSVHRYLEAIGIYLIAICIVGRVLCSVYISGHKSIEIIEVGPYSVCRNPLYVFSLLGAIGVGIMSGSVVVSVLFGAVTWTVLRIVVSREESFLLSKHGDLYKQYMNRVPRFWPNFALWTSGDSIVVRTRGVIRTFADASLFLLAVPLIEVLEYLKETGWMPVLIGLP